MKLVRASTLHAKILFWFFLISVPPLLITVFFTYQYARTAVQSEIHGFLDEYANKQTHIIDNYVAERKGDIHIFSQLPILKEVFPKLEETFLKSGADGPLSVDGQLPMDSPVYLDWEKKLPFIAQDIVKTYGYKNFYLISRNGDVIFSAMPGWLFRTNIFSGVAKDSELSRLVKAVLETQAARLSSFAFYPDLNAEVAAYVAAPIFSERLTADRLLIADRPPAAQGKNVIGILALSISPDSIYEIVSDYTGLGETGETVIGSRIGDEAVFIAPMRFDPEGAFKHRAKIGSSYTLPMQNAVLEKTGHGHATDYRGQPVWAVWRYLPSLRLGMVVKMDLEEINSRTATIKTVSIFLTVVTFLLAVGLAARVAKSITKPIERLTTATQALADGHLEQRAEILEKNEIGVLADSFNNMADKLKNSYARINKEMIYVQLLHEVAAAANEAQSVEAAMQKAMRHICGIIGWPLGHLYLTVGNRLDSDALQKAIPTNLWQVSDPEKYAAFMKITDKTELQSGIGLPGRILSSGKPEWIRDIIQDPNFPRARDAAGEEKPDIGVRTGCAFPIVTKEGVVGILEFFSPETIERDERLLEVMVNMGMQLGYVVERKRAEEELKLHRNHLERLVEERTAELKKVHEKYVHAEKLSALGKLTGSIAHEFNNPIYGIRNVLEQMQENLVLTEEQKYLFNLAVKECNRVASMVMRLRDFYKPSDGIKVPMDIHQALDDTILLMQKKLKAQKITLKKDYAPGLPKILAVEDQMKQVFLNLLQNAADAICSDGSPPPDDPLPQEAGTITVVSRMLDGNVVKISVKDTGEGILPEIMNLIFDPFFSTKAIKGTGLGLSVCHGIIKAHGGDIDVESDPGKGTVFTVTLPVKETLAS